MTKIAKITSVVLMIMLILTMTTSVFAATSTATGSADPSLVGNKVTYDNTDSIRDFGGTIIGFLQVIGSVVAIAILVVLGIKYMLGSAEEKAEYKKTMIPYIVGAVLIFAAVTIANMVYNFTSTI